LHANEKLVVGYAYGKPVSIGILFVSVDSAGIFSLVTSEDFQGKGYGTDMMVFLMKIAKDYGCHSITLSASSDSGYRIYERLGFSKLGEFECFEYKGDST
jgi:ribosomal protein S18 acetylase RimI-like enzyme